MECILNAMLCSDNIDLEKSLINFSKQVKLKFELST